MRQARLALVMLLLTASSAAAEVVERTPAAFTVRTSVTAAGSPSRVYEALVREIGAWWDPAHTFSGSAANLTLDAAPGGCFCERLPSGGGVQHAIVVHAAPGQLLRLSGALGPLQSAAVTGTLTWQLAPADEGSANVTVTYAAAGAFPGGLDRIADAVDTVIGDQVRRLKAHVDRSSR